MTCCAGSVHVVHIQPKKVALDHEHFTASTQQLELDHTDHTDHADHADQESIWSEISRPLSGNRRSD